jgi:hypothetical protein
LIEAASASIAEEGKRAIGFDVAAGFLGGEAEARPAVLGRGDHAAPLVEAILIAFTDADTQAIMAELAGFADPPSTAFDATRLIL